MSQWRVSQWVSVSVEGEATETERSQRITAEREEGNGAVGEDSAPTTDKTAAIQTEGNGAEITAGRDGHEPAAGSCLRSAETAAIQTEGNGAEITAVAGRADAGGMPLPYMEGTTESAPATDNKAAIQGSGAETDTERSQRTAPLPYMAAEREEGKEAAGKVIGRMAWVVLVWMFLLAGMVGVQGAPFEGDLRFVQPDGTEVVIHGKGDEFYAVLETKEGYAVVFDTTANAYCYAELAGDGSLVSTGVQAHRKAPPGLERGLRMKPEARKRQVAEKRARWEAGTGNGERWRAMKEARRAEEGRGKRAETGNLKPEGEKEGNGAVGEDSALTTDSTTTKNGTETDTERSQRITAMAGRAEARGMPLPYMEGTTESAPATEGPSFGPPSFQTTGLKVGLTLLIDFADDPGTIAQAEVVKFCNEQGYSGYGNKGSVRDYFFDVSNGRLTYTNVVTVYVRVPRLKSFYNDTTEDSGARANVLIKDALDTLKALPNYYSEILPTFGALTSDGSGRVVACNVFYAGGNGGAWSKGLWPHAWSLYNVGAQALGNGKSVYKYQITNIGSSLALGTFCHENGHMLCGFPDIYDYDYDSTGGAGQFCLMNSGGSGTNPRQVSAYLKRAAGWATTVEINSSSQFFGELTAGAGANFNRFYRYQKPGVSTEYFLIENRQKWHRDSGLPSAGIAVWHIDERGDKDNQSTNFNTTHANYEVSLVQADGRYDFQRDVNSGDAGDLFFKGNTSAGYRNEFSVQSVPPARWWDGTSSGLVLGDFSTPADRMTFRVGAAPPVLNVTQSFVEDGNGNGVVDFSEEVRLWVVLRNNGVIAATNVLLDVVAEHDEVQMTMMRVAYPDIAPGTSATNLTPVQFVTTAALPCATPLAVRALATSTGRTTTNYLFYTTGCTPGTWQPPQVRVTSITNEQVFEAGQSIRLAAEASDPDGMVMSVEFREGNNLLGLVTTPPYEATWSMPSAGVKSVTVTATDNSGLTKRETLRVGVAEAGPMRWIGGGSTRHWSDGWNWTGLRSPVAYEGLTFSGVKTGAITNDLALSTGLLTFASGGFVLEGNVVTVTGVNNTGTNRVASPLKLVGSAWLNITNELRLSGGVTNPGQLKVNGPGTLVVESPVSGTGSLIKGGTGTTRLVVANGYTAGTIVSNGVLALAAGGATGTIRGQATVVAGGTLRTEATDALGYNGSSRVSTLILNGGKLQHTASGNLSLWGASVLMTGGTLEAAGTGSNAIDLGTDSSAGNVASLVNVSPSGTPSVIAGNQLRLRQANTDFNVADGAAGYDLVVSAPVVSVPSNAGLTKKGWGTMVLSGQSSLTGTLYVNGGTLLVNGSLGTNPVTVYAGGTLGGVGQVRGKVTLNSGAALAPGTNGIGMFAISNSLSVGPGTLRMEIRKQGGVRSADLLSGITTLTYGGRLEVTNIGSEPLAAGDFFRLFAANSYGGAFVVRDLPALSPGLGWDVSQLTVNGTIRVGVVPYFASEPASMVTTNGQPLSLSFQAFGTTPMSVQWYRNNQLLGAVSNPLDLTPADPGDAGDYQVVLSNASGAVTSAVARVVVLVPPSIVTGPASVQAEPGTAVRFQVSAAGTGPLGYQWLRGETEIAGATGPEWSIASVSDADAGSYRVRVSNEAGSVMSAAASLTVGAAEQPVLSLTVSQGEATLWWPEHFAGYRLQTAGEPGAGAPWQDVPGVASNRVTVPLSPGAGQVFFRLEKAKQ